MTTLWVRRAARTGLVGCVVACMIGHTARTLALEDLFVLPHRVVVRRPPTRASPPAARDLDGLLARFCGGCVGGGPLAVAASAPIALTLVATLVADPAARSLATVIDPASGAQGAFRTGDHLPGGAELVAVASSFIYVSVGGGSPQRVDLGRGGPAGALVTPDPPAITSAVHRRADGVLEVDRAAWDQLKQDPLGRGGARISPTEGGLRVSAIKRGSLAAAVGLENGDVVVGIDGAPLGSADEALRAMARLERGDQVRVDLLRRKQPLSLVLTLR